MSRIKEYARKYEETYDSSSSTSAPPAPAPNTSTS